MKSLMTQLINFEYLHGFESPTSNNSTTSHLIILGENALIRPEVC